MSGLPGLSGPAGAGRAWRCRKRALSLVVLVFVAVLAALFTWQLTLGTIIMPATALPKTVSATVDASSPIEENEDTHPVIALAHSFRPRCAVPCRYVASPRFDHKADVILLNQKVGSSTPESLGKRRNHQLYATFQRLNDVDSEGWPSATHAADIWLDGSGTDSVCKLCEVAKWLMREEYGPARWWNPDYEPAPLTDAKKR